jgi:SAM-dependent methyltransferase
MRCLLGRLILSTPEQGAISVDLTQYRGSAPEQERVADLMRLVPSGIRSVLDVGARDGYLSIRLAEFVPSVTALDLDSPRIPDARVNCVAGDATRLEFADGHFDLALCAEVLEHLPGDTLTKACAELARVSGRYLLIGVPFNQDLRVGRMTCQSCGCTTPSWGHVNSFTEARLVSLFPSHRPAEISYVGINRDRTNALAAWMMDLAGNPYGTYQQEEPCVHCGNRLRGPPPRTFVQKVLTKGGMWVGKLSSRGFSQPNWIHVLLSRK